MSRSKSADKPSVEFIEKLYDTQVQQKNLTPATHPNVVFVTGVAGSGKSYNTRNVKENPIFNVFSIHPDDYRKLHPKINQLIEKHGRDNAHEHTGSFANRTALALRDKAIKNRLNVVYETTFGNIETAKNLINSFADNGYRVTVIALPVNLELSLERNENRYQAKKEDIHTLPRKVSLEHIQKMANNFMNNLNELENNGVVIYRVSNHHEARQTINDTVVSLQKNTLTQQELNKTAIIFAKETYKTLAKTLNGQDKVRLKMYQDAVAQTIAQEKDPNQKQAAWLHFYQYATERIKDGKLNLPKPIPTEQAQQMIKQLTQAQSQTQNTQTPKKHKR